MVGSRFYLAVHQVLNIRIPSCHPFLGAQFAIESGIDIGLANGLEECIGGQAYGYVQNETSDWVNSARLFF